MNNTNHPEPEYSYEITAGSSTVCAAVYHTVTSTNDICRDYAASGYRGIFAAIAMNQTRGRGRLGRSFFSPDDTGLYMSIIVRPDHLSGDQALRLTTMSAVAAAEAIEAVSGRQADIKWVNDIYIDGRKVCGILTEASFEPSTGMLESAVIGIGINIYTPECGFPEDIRDTAGSVLGLRCHADPALQDDGKDIRLVLADTLISRFMHYYDYAFTDNMSSGEGYAAEYRRRCFVIGKRIGIIQNSYSSHVKESTPALVLDVDDSMGLIVRYDDGREETLTTGEISIRLLKP